MGQLKEEGGRDGESEEKRESEEKVEGGRERESERVWELGK